jgi:hypothetical protein
LKGTFVEFVSAGESKQPLAIPSYPFLLLKAEQVLN